jgi:hypothetical protein
MPFWSKTAQTETLVVDMWSHFENGSKKKSLKLFWLQKKAQNTYFFVMSHRREQHTNISTKIEPKMIPQSLMQLSA